MQVSQIAAQTLKINHDRLYADFEELAQIGATPEGGVNRLALSSEDLRARAWFANKVEEAGLLVRDDDAGNLSGVLLSDHSHARTFIIGSHLDSVPNGGRYDGAIGVLGALECLRTIKEAGLTLPMHLEAIDFTDDEGAWQSLFGSRALVGRISPEDLSDSRINNAPFRAALTRAGIEPRTIGRARRDPRSVAGYVELHIEQGPRLERAGVQIGVVTGIVGRTNYRLTFSGLASHSGTTEMDKRRDALRGAATFIVRGHELARERYTEGIFNCGTVEVLPGAFNIVPSQASVTVEIRHVSEKLMSDMETAIINLAHECATSHALTLETEMIIHMPATSLAAGVIQAVESACDIVGATRMPLISYAGHDAQMMAMFTPSGMVFIPSVNGIGHNPLEFSHWDDVITGTNVLLQTVLNLTLRQADDQKPST